MKELSLCKSTDIIAKTILKDSNCNSNSQAKYNPIGDNIIASLSESKNQQKRHKFRVIKQLFKWKKQGYKIVKFE